MRQNGRIARRATFFVVLLLILGVSTVLARFVNPTVSIASATPSSVYRGSSTTISGSYGSGQGNFLKFDAIDDYVKVVNSASLQPTSAITIEAWIYPTPPHQANVGGIINNINGYANSRLLVFNNGQLLAQVFIGDSYQNVPGPYVINNRWNQVVYVYNGTHEYWVANGVKGSVYAKTGSINTGTYNRTIGWGYTGTGYYHFNGSIAQVRIYNRSLSDSEILNNFRNPNSPVTNGLVMWLKMNEGAGTTVYDYSGNGNNGAIYGATWVTYASPVTSVYVNITDSSGTLAVTKGLATLSNPLQNGTWSYTFTTSASSSLGSYTVYAKAIDLSGNYSITSLSNAFYVFNNPPRIYNTGVDPATRQVGNTLTLWVNASDYETFPLSGTATIIDPNGNKVSLALQYKATTKRYEALYTPPVAGSYSVSFTVSDADSASASSSYSFIAVTSPIIAVSDQTATYNYNGVQVSAIVNYADHYYFYYQTNNSIDGYTVINLTAKQIYKTYKLPAGTYTITVYASNSATGQTSSKSFTLTINKATPSLSLSLPSSVRWMDGFTITASENNMGDNDVAYKTFINNTYLGGIGTFSVQEASGLYVVKLNATGGQNYTANEITQQITVLKAWEKTDGIDANKSYYYDLGKTAVPVVAYQKNSRPANGTVIAGKPLYILSDITAVNNNGNTGLQSTFTNIYINTTAPSGFQSITVLIPSLAYNQQVSLTTITGKAVTAYGKFYSCTTGRCTYILTVNESVYTPNLQIAYTLPYPPPNWHIRKDYTIYIDGKTTGFTFYPDNLTVIVPTTFSSSSLKTGDHNTTIIYTTLSEQIEETNQSIISKLSDLLKSINLTIISKLGSVNISLADLIKSSNLSIISQLSNVNLSIISQLGKVNISLSNLIESANLSLSNLMKNVNTTLADLIKSSNLSIIKQITGSTNNITVLINNTKVDLEGRLSDILSAVTGVNRSVISQLMAVNTSLSKQVGGVNQSIAQLSSKLESVNLSIVSQLGKVNISLSDLIRSANLNATSLIKNTNMTLADLIRSSNLTIIRQILNSTGNITVYVNGTRVGLESRLSDILKAITTTNSTLEGRLSDILGRLKATSTRGTISLPAIPSPSFLAFANLPAITVSSVVMALLVFLFGILLYKKYREGR